MNIYCILCTYYIAPTTFWLTVSMNHAWPESAAQQATRFECIAASPA